MSWSHLFVSVSLLLNCVICNSDWDCSQSASVPANRYGDLGGGLIQNISGLGTGCSSDSSRFKISGSSTVYPLAKIWAVEFNQCQQEGCNTIELSGGGSSQGASDACDGISEIGDMSRDFKSSEGFKYSQDEYVVGCQGSDVYRTLSQIPVALDGVTIFIQKGTTLETCLIDTLGGLSYGDLRWIFSSYTDTQLIGDESYVPENSQNIRDSRLWSELHSSCPNETINIYGSDNQGGTYSFLSDEIFNGDTFAIERNYREYEDDDELMDDILDDPYGIGYEGYSHYLRNVDSLTAIPISDETTTGSGTSSSYEAVTADSIEDGSYPIARTIYMNIDNENFALNDAIYDYLSYGFSDAGQILLQNVSGYVPLPTDTLNEVKSYIENRGIFSDDYDYGDLGGGESTVYQTTTSDCNSYESYNMSGSSTVYPVARIWAYNYIEWASNDERCVEIYLSGGGSSFGGRQVCNGIVDIGLMSRDYKDNEALKLNDDYTHQCLTPEYSDICYRVSQLSVALDGITVFVKIDSTLASCLSNGLNYTQLETIFGASDTVNYWDEILDNSNCPHEEVDLYIPGTGTTSGTVNFFCDEVFNNGNCIATTFYSNSILTISEDDDTILDGVINNEYGIGFAGYAHYQRQEANLFAIPINGASPSITTIDDGTYTFSRKLFMNVRKDSQSDENVQSFLNFGLNTEIGQLLLENVIGYVKLDEDTLDDQIDHIEGNSIYWNIQEDGNCQYVVPTTTDKPNHHHGGSGGNTSTVKKNNDYDDEITGLTIALVILALAFCCMMSIGFYYLYNNAQSSKSWSKVQEENDEI